jgi:hypothetical protein
MIEFSMLELVLLMANIVSWGAYFKASEQEKIARNVLMHFVKDEKAREEIVRKWEEHKKTYGV